MSSEVIEYESPESFLRVVEPWLEQREVENNLILGLLYRYRQMEQEGQTLPVSLLATIGETGRRPELVVLLNAINLVIAQVSDELSQTAVTNLVAYLYDSGKQVPGIVGPVNAVQAIAEAWAKHNGLTAYLKMNQRIYQLDQVNRIAEASGELIRAEAEHEDLVTQWTYEMAKAIGEPISHEEARTKAIENIKTQSLYLWQDGPIVSMAKKTRPTQHGIVIALVYTPPAYRNHGYASSCVAGLSRLLLDQGYRFCSLYTDLSNPTSNRIYQAIGYRPVQDSVAYRFKE